MIRATRWERFCWFFANQSAQLAFNAITQNPQDWQVAQSEVRSRCGRHRIEFNQDLSRFTLVVPIRQSFGFFGSLLLRSLVKRIRLTYLQRKLKTS